jgi:hypothetical protein
LNQKRLNLSQAGDIVLYYYWPRIPEKLGGLSEYCEVIEILRPLGAYAYLKQYGTCFSHEKSKEKNHT